MDKTNKPIMSKIQKAYLIALKDYQDTKGQNSGHNKGKLIGDTDTHHTPFRGGSDVLSHQSKKSNVEESL